MKTLCLLLTCFIMLTVAAQEKLVIMGKPTDMYVVHAASGAENLQGISNGFGLSVTKLSTYNKVNINPTAVLAKGTEIKVPLTKNNLLQQTNDNSAPVYHKIKKGENLYRLSQAYNKVPLASIREWNHMKKDLVKDGQLVIIGYMVNAKPVAVVAEKKSELKKEAPALNNKVVIEDSGRRFFPDKIIPNAPSSISKDQAVNVKPVLPKTKVVEDKPAVIGAKKKEEITSIEYSPREGDEGYFASGYAEHTKEQTQQFHSGDAAIFKTISGWTDRKFYVLMNDIAPKTIIRITGPGNKSICAMVLGPLQETKGGNGLLLRLSNSAASALGLTDPKFTVTVTYFE